MPRSTGNFISYDLRPAKQAERRILVDVLKLSGEAGLPISDYRYVGMGASRFYDFLLVHRYLGITNMISLEHDEKFFKRAEFNVPYGFIDVENVSAQDFAMKDCADTRSIYWLDYDGGVGQQIVGDIFSYAGKCKRGDFVFITVAGNPPRVVDRVSDSERLVWIQENLGDFAGQLDVEDMQRAGFQHAVFKIVVAAFKNAFASRRDGKFFRLLQVEYSDSMPMVTIGGAFLSEGQSVDICAKMSRSLPFLKIDSDRMYKIRSLHVTEKERALFDKAVTSKSKNIRELKQLKKLGFGDQDIATYRDLLRYIPRYVEAIV